MNEFVAILSIILLANLTFHSSTYAQSEHECNPVIEKSPHMRLEEYLFCEYEADDLPSVNGKNVTHVSIQLTPQFANFDEESDNLEMVGWLFVEWIDPHLTWNASAFEDLAELKVRSYRIWLPEIAILSAGNEESNDYGFPYDTPCSLWKHGDISCLVQIRHTIRCQTDFTQWPFDRQNCTLVLSTWLRSSEQVTFDMESDMSLFESDQEWTLTASEVIYDQRKSSFSTRQEATSPRLSVDFILDRVHNQLSGRYVSPAIIMMVMTLTTLVLDARSTERLAVACVNFIIHLFCIQNLHWVLPHNGSTVPNILLFYASSLILATVALLLTFLLRNLQEMKIDPPKCIASSTATILRSRVGYIFFMSMLDPRVAAEIEPDADDSGDLRNINSKTTVWGYVAIMCGWISFLVSLLTYVVMYAVFVPNPSTSPPITDVGYRY